MDIVIWSVTLLLMFAGLVGSFVPLLPGSTLILLGVLLQKWLLPATLSWEAIGVIAAVWLLSLGAEVGCALIGTRLFGGSKWGLAGASGGALVGLFFSLPGLVLGSVLGAIAAEKCLGRRTDGAALQAGAGAAFGFVLSIFARVGCALVMIGAYALSVLHTLPPAS